MLLCVLITLILLAISINISEKVFYPRRNAKVNNKYFYVRPSHSNKYNSQRRKCFTVYNFLIGFFINCIKNKQKGKNIKVQNKYEMKNYKKIIKWPKN
jgi:hypothetical protein